MARRTLLDFFDDLASIDAGFIVHDDGYRTWSYTYAEISAAARAFAATLRAARIGPDQKVVLWSENRPEWIVVLWGCLLEGVIVVPIDYRASAELMLRVAGIVDAAAIAVGDVVPEFETTRPIFRLSALPGDSHSYRGQPQLAVAVPDGGGGAEATAEIIFTSGATAEPKGVVLTHRNILANIVPIEREINKYKKYARPFSPIRFLNLLPLSHMFGQSMATFIPPLLAGEVVFMRSFAPQDIVAQIHDRRISVLVCVPKVLEVLRDYLGRVAPETAEAPPPGTHWAKRWWIYRRVHRLLGWKFWAVVVGAAPLDPELEAFWGRLGFLVVQGYGLTETAPVVTLNHPLHAAKGAVGKPIAGVEVKIAEDGEILVRGENVTRGYFNAPEETRAAFQDGWFRTGDIGELDATGHLHIKGRKKEMIVTPEGLNVFPEDVERVLNAIPGVKESAAVGTDRVQAVLVVAPGADVEAIVRQANGQLLDHQKIRSAAVWPLAELPRTEGTRKLKRRELKQWLESASATVPTVKGDTSRTVEGVVARFAPGRTVTRDTTIDELGLSSLERVELMLALEETFQVTIDEGQFAAAATLADLHKLVEIEEAFRLQANATGSLDTQSGASASRPKEEVIDFPAWNRSAPARIARRVSLPTWILPPTRFWMSLDVSGLEHLDTIDGPVVFAANHQSHFDTPAILQALPPRWRYRVAPAMAKEFFKAHFFPEQFGRKAYLLNSLNYYLASLFFNAFPLPQREAGTRQTLRYAGELLADGYSILIFPEGKRTEHGEINEFKPGVGMIASRLSVPVVPVRLEGLERILHLKARFPTRGRASVRFGPRLTLTGDDYKALAQRIENAVKSL